MKSYPLGFGVIPDMLRIRNGRLTPRKRYPKTLPEQDRRKPREDALRVVERETVRDEYQRREVVEE